MNKNYIEVCPKGGILYHIKKEKYEYTQCELNEGICSNCINCSATLDIRGIKNENNR
jgi:hypothetical protein